jgi:hypothetical protein
MPFWFLRHSLGGSNPSISVPLLASTSKVVRRVTQSRTLANREHRRAPRDPGYQISPLVISANHFQTTTFIPRLRPRPFKTGKVLADGHCHDDGNPGNKLQSAVASNLPSSPTRIRPARSTITWTPRPAALATGDTRRINVAFPG